MLLPPSHVLYEDNHLLVLNKPAGLATMGVREGEPSLFLAACDYVKRKFHKPGKVYLGVVSRLDAMASGVIVFARTSKSAARLSRQFHDRTVEKTYLAIVEGRVSPREGLWEDWVQKDEAAARMIVVSKPSRPDDSRATRPTGAASHVDPSHEDGSSGPKLARLSYRTLSSTRVTTQLEIALETGRKHQIRVQAASRGHPILGDRKYGSRRPFPQGIALHARRLSFDHPVRDERLTFEAPPPAGFALE